MKPRVVLWAALAVAVVVGGYNVAEDLCYRPDGITVFGSTFYCVTVPMNGDADGGD